MITHEELIAAIAESLYHNTPALYKNAEEVSWRPPQLEQITDADYRIYAEAIIRDIPFLYAASQGLPKVRELFSFIHDNVDCRTSELNQELTRLYAAAIAEIGGVG